VSDRQKNLNLPSSLENFARGLLSTTCLTVVCGSGAVAGTVNLPNSDFPNSSPGVLLPAGTTVVNGFAGGLPSEGGSLTPEWFEFQGLTSGDTYILTASYNPLGRREESGNGESGLRLNVFTSSLSPLFTGQSLETAGRGGTGAMVSGGVPGDGFLDIEITANVETPGSFYQVTLSEEAGSSTAPEPGTLVPVGLGLAGALAWSRKRRS
jgi:hypothetical protein